MTQHKVVILLTMFFIIPPFNNIFRFVFNIYSVMNSNKTFM
jgi:hypothetical protein